ncbi:transporter substrate-binding domain-containing protein [Legionella waltersii]|uniref:Arginine ABC transporter substrate-binding protein n=1 Tax=Legionella waltersii TaxID=66969 RepID=A0A0W1A059_9GAMM|nr:transporter substrate-binding domain-containing protein [Legionella waltersii]KTD74754.1 arginine ABC transporter substrate-binding protein [Legionella waltersii]SNV00238.1 arginine ABC transporter substrate-binding protein [Legionella waltersii]
MRFIKGLLLTLLISISTLYAQNEPLTIGTTNFNPPFVMRTANNELFGFDIDMMINVCKIMNRKCNFEILRFEELLPAVASKRIDMAVGSITITAERANIVAFSLPYLLSYSRFLTLQSTADKTPFSLEALNNKRFGIASKTVFSAQIKDMGIANPTIVEFDKYESMLEALRDNSIDFILMDSPSAVYWAANSGNSFKTYGNAFMYGYGFGVAVNRENTALLSQLNQALLKFQNSDSYKQAYQKYLSSF